MIKSHRDSLLGGEDVAQDWMEEVEDDAFDTDDDDEEEAVDVSGGYSRLRLSKEVKMQMKA